MTNRTRIPRATSVRTTFANHSSTTPRSAARDVGPCLYAIRIADGTIKIGFSTKIYQRLVHLGPLADVLAIVPGTWEDEQAIHRSLRPHVAHSREYYRATPAVLSVVNDMRAAARLQPIAA